MSKTISGFILAATIFTGVIPRVYAITPAEITQQSERLSSDFGALAAAAELTGADSELFNRFNVGLKYGEFYVRLWQGDYWGVAWDFVKFELSEKWDEFVDAATKKAFSEGTQRTLAVFSALKSLGEWAGNRAMDMQFNAAVRAGWQTYLDSASGSDLQDMMDIWWTQYGNNAKLNELGDVFVWKEKFAKVHALQNQTQATTANASEVVQVQKAIKKSAVISYFQLKYPGIGSNVAEELADAIVKKDSAAIKSIAEKYKDHLEKLSASGAAGGESTVSPDGLCGKLATKEEKENCLETAARIITDKGRVLSNAILYKSTGFSSWKDDDILAPLVDEQMKILEAAYNKTFGQPIKDIEAELSFVKAEFSRKFTAPSATQRVNPPDFSYKFIIWDRDDSLYRDYEAGTAKKTYDIYVENSLADQVGDKKDLLSFKAELARLNSIRQSLAGLDARISRLDSMFESAPGILSVEISSDDFGPVIEAAREFYTKKWQKEIAQMKNGEERWWRPWGMPGLIRTIQHLQESVASVEKAIIEESKMLTSVKEEYAGALKRYAKLKKQKNEDSTRIAEELAEAIAARDKALAEEKAAEEKRAAESKSWWQSVVQKARDYLAEREAKKEAAQARKIIEQQELAQKGIKIFDVSTEEGKQAYEESTRAREEQMLKDTETKRQAEAEATREREAQKTVTRSNTVVSGNDLGQFVESGFVLGYAPCGESMVCFWTGSVEDSGFYILDLGAVSIDSITSVPSSGYTLVAPQPNSDFPGFFSANSFKPAPGHVYAMKSDDGKYGVFRIDLVSGNDYKVAWKYQSNGTAQFSAGPASAPEQNVLSGYAELMSRAVESESLGFRFDSLGGQTVNSGNFDFYWNDDGFFAGPGAGIIDLGMKSLDSVTSVPSSGYSEKARAEKGRSYAIKTDSGKYGAIEIMGIVSGWYQAQTIRFNWKYQPDGSTSF